jgi:hypothetical protein
VSDSDERERRYECDVDAISARRRRKINATAGQERDANREAARLGLRFERRVGEGGSYVRNVTYCMFRSSWNVARYCPVTSKLTIGNKQYDADTLIEAVRLTSRYEGLAQKTIGQCEQATPAPTKKGKKPKTTHHPKQKSREAKGQKLPRIAPTMNLSDDDLQRILRWGENAAQADEATGLNRISLNRELVGRIRDALDDGCKLLYTPAPLKHEPAMEHWELN